MARLQSLRPQVASLPSRLKSTFTLAKEQEAYGQGRGGRPWRRKREAVLKRDGYLCQPCKRMDRITLATEVDHVIPQAEGGSEDESNLQAICTDCHKAKTAEEAKRGANRSRSGGASQRGTRS